jgi:hypothetical protein
MAFEFPLLLLHEASHDWNLVGTTMAAGQTVSAAVDVRSDGGGFWVASLNDIQLWHREYALLWRATRQLANGGVGQVVVSRRDQLAPWPNGLTDYGAFAFDDDTLFDDGSGFDQPVIDVVVNAAAALRATTIALQLVNCGDLLGGEAFAIEHPTYGWRMYEIATVTDVSDGVVSVTFNPPLREALAGGEAVEFDRPRCLMKLVNSGAMDLNLTVLPDSRASVKFVETKFGS